MASIDERVVRMRMDTDQFEAGVSKTSSLLGKLKQSLKLDKSVQGFKNLDSAAKSINLNSLSIGAQAAGSAFSAMGSIGFPVLQRLTNETNRFEAGVSKTSSLLGKLKQSLKLDKSVQGFKNLDSAAKSINLNSLSIGAQAAGSAFSAMGSIGFSVLQRLTNETINLAGTLTNTLTSGIRQGFKEYETQLNSVQTILANTQSKGSTLNDVNDALDTLNSYADQTIYNFTEMTRNIGTFTAAGVDLNTSVDSIKGIANLAAVSGSSSQQASQAMYQLSQALAAGRVSLMDWNSVVNAGMGGEVFQTALKRTATQMGTNVDALINKYGSFRESLTEGQWLTTDVLTETLKQLSGAYSESDLIAQGYSADQAKQIVELAKTAQSAATDVKTFTQLVDTTKEAIGSGWTQTFEILIGDFEEAKELWSQVGQVLSTAVNDSATARNEMLQSWKDMGGRQTLINGFSNAFTALGKVLSTVGDAFLDVFPPTTAKQLLSMAKSFESFTKSLIPSESTLRKIGDVARGVFSVFSIGISVIKAFGQGIANAFGGNGGSFLNTLLNLAAGLGNFITGLDNSIKQFGILNGVASAVELVFSGILGIFTSASNGIAGFSSIVQSAASAIGSAFDWIFDKVGSVLTWIKDNISAGDIFAGLAGGGIFVAAKKIGGAFDTIKEKMEGLFDKGEKGGGNLKKWSESFQEVLSGLSDSLNAFTGSVKAFTLVEIAAAIALLVNSLRRISELDAGEVAGGITAIGAMMVELNLSLKSIGKTLDKMDTKGIVKTGAALILFAKAINILSGALVTMGGMSWNQIGRGLTAMGGAMAEMIAAMKGLSYAKGSIKTAASVLILAKSLGDIAKALGDFGSYDWGTIGRGLTAMGGALGEIGLVLTGVGKLAGASSLFASGAIFITAKGLNDIAVAFGTFGSYDWGTIGRGLAAMGGALAEIGIVTGALGKLAGISGIFAAGTIYITAKGLNDLSVSFGTFGSYDWGTIGRGLVAMGGALAEIGIVSGALGKIAGISGLFGAGTIYITVQGLEQLATSFGIFGSYDWATIGRGIVAMGAALLEVGGMSGALGMIAGLSGLIGAGTIYLTVQSLDQLANGLLKFGSMDWGTIGKGLVAMGAALVTVGGMSGAIGAIAGLAGLIGAGTVAITVQGLDQLANALAKFGAMDWGTIGRGITAMVGAMGAAGLGALQNTFSGFGADALATYAGPLGTLADSVKKWGGVTVPANLGPALSSLADGVLKFTFGGMGVGTISSVVGPLGTMADSVKKWNGTALNPAIGTQLTFLADGVKSFTLAFAGGWSISQVVGPLGELATSVKKWNGVSVPPSIGTQLSNLSDGVKSFGLAFLGGWSIGAVAGPLGTLATSVKKWNGVTVPAGISSQLSDLANGAKSFSGINASGVTAGANSLGTLASAVSRLGAANMVGVGTSLTTFVSKVNNAGTITSTLPSQLSSFAGQMSSSISSLTGQVNSASSSMSGAFNGMRSGISGSLSGISSTVSSSMTAIGNAVNSGRSTIGMAIGNIPNTIRGYSGQFQSSGQNLSQALLNGLKSQTGSFLGAFSNALNAAANGARSSYGSFFSAGSYAASGLAAGIRSNIWSAANAAAAIAQAASNAAKANLDIHSPSRVFAWIGQMTVKGFTNALDDSQNAVNESGASIGNAAYAGINGAIQDGLTFEPTIAPVMDLSNVQNGVNSVDQMLSDQRSFGLSTDRILASRANMAFQGLQTTQATRYDNSDVVASVIKLGDRIDGIASAVSKMNVIMDGKQLVGSISGRMDRKLGKSVQLGNRYI